MSGDRAEETYNLGSSIGSRESTCKRSRRVFDPGMKKPGSEPVTSQRGNMV